MRAFPILFAVLSLSAAGCSQDSSTEPSVSMIETPEIIRILEEDDIDSIWTTHAQTVEIELQDGRRFQGEYVHEQAGEYADNEHLFDILNLVAHIQEKRSAEEKQNLSWKIYAE